ncbi:DedA [Thermus sp. CCB_US3_UF1]|uniref:VTT domain-containing protein n=2 Tax=Thermus TaxID=270 RepID=UPI0002389699|nr:MULTISPECIES: VTT domain-containing protein [unclassified Thermus]AEV15822.1 DedA [Thermus sp. CCB_US3_UF1]MCS6867443.1 VTT domain-containing protein [Thermus sp.]MCX7850339.1 VTT domain-containing protein [Thermus sp.]
MLAYLLPALVLFLEVGFPLGFLVPGGDTLLLFLGALAGEGKLSLFPLLPLLFLGSALGHLLGYALGRALGGRLKPRLPQDLWQRGERVLLRFGPSALLLAPFVPGLRTALPLLLGALGFPFLPYLLLSALGSLLWTQGLVLLAYVLGQKVPAWLLWPALLLLALLPLLRKRP